MNKNLALFAERFPQLYEQAGFARTVPQNVLELCGMELSQTKGGSPNALFGGKALHSAYDPEREAQKLVETDSVKRASAAVFMGFGLGYAPLAFAAAHPEKTLVLVENDPLWFLAALSLLDWTKVFEHPSCVVLLAAPQQYVIAVLEKIGIKECAFLHNKNQTLHAEPYFSALEQLVERNRQKNEINRRTLEKFSLLWLRNMCRNLQAAKNLDGITKFQGVFAGVPACVIAAGPSLDEVLPHLKEIHERCVTVCVDTALRACLGAGVEPDFIIVCDPQYWNLRHLDGLASPSSTLVTELAAYPPVFRFKCREIVLCSSLYPLGKFIEKRTEPRGELGAGGSVVTSAWDFARQCGCKTVFMAGLDLGFPENKTHFKGSTFEERAHRLSTRLHTAESDGFSALYGAAPYLVDDNAGGKVLTDKRMALYAWWFESKCAEFRKTQTLSLSAHGVHIPGIDFVPLEKLLGLPDARERKALIRLAVPFPNAEVLAARHKAFNEACAEAVRQLDSILHKARQAKELCAQLLQGKGSAAAATQKLSEIDRKIMQSEAAELASLVFPGEEKLEKLCDSCSNPIEKSLVIYSEIIRSVALHKGLLEKSK